VFGTPVLRAIAVLVFSAMLFSIVPEGLAAAWANEHPNVNMNPGTAQAVIMVANPLGFILGGLLVSRLFGPARRLALMRPLAVLSPLVLVPALLNPSPLVVALLAALCGFAVAGMLPMANGLFVQALPAGFRARAFGVMATGVQVIQGLAVLITGMLSERFSIPMVVGVWSAVGVVLMTIASLRWPDKQTIDATIAAATAANATPAPAPAAPAPGTPAAGTPTGAAPAPRGPAAGDMARGTDPRSGDDRHRQAVT